MDSPIISCSIHSGSLIRNSINHKIGLNVNQRFLEEDNFVEELIHNTPISISSPTSRYEYDLNRNPSECIYDWAWGKKVWKLPLSQEDINLSLNKHYHFYVKTKDIVARTICKYGFCIIIDFHSYNYSKYIDPPIFNIGIKHIKKNHFYLVEKIISILKETTKGSNYEDIAINKVFEGAGYFSEFFNLNYDSVLVIPIEIKKIYIYNGTKIKIDRIFNDLQKIITNFTKRLNNHFKHVGFNDL